MTRQREREKEKERRRERENEITREREGGRAKAPDTGRVILRENGRTGALNDHPGVRFSAPLVVLPAQAR